MADVGGCVQQLLDVVDHTVQLQITGHHVLTRPNKTRGSTKQVTNRLLHVAVRGSHIQIDMTYKKLCSLLTGISVDPEAESLLAVCVLEPTAELCSWAASATFC